MHHSRSGFTFVLIALALLLTVPVYSQTGATGTITGQVVDQQNAAVPGAEVKLLDIATNSAQTTLTNETGRYIFASVSPGVYNLTITKEGFSVYRLAKQSVQVGLTLTINANLSVGATTTTVEVSDRKSVV